MKNLHEKMRVLYLGDLMGESPSFPGRLTGGVKGAAASTKIRK
jgi:hypothetical protein